MAKLLPAAAALALAAGSDPGYEKCTTGGLSEVLLAQRTEVEAFYLDFGREAEAQADAAIRNLWLGTPHASSFPSYADMTDVGGGGCKADGSLTRLSDVYWTGWSQTEWFNNSCPVEMKKQGYTGADWQWAKQAGCTYNETTVISDYCAREYPECPTESALNSSVDVDYLEWHFSGPAGTRGWKTHDNYTFCPVFCLQPNRFNNSLNEFAMQLSDGAELRWHELTSNSFKGGLRPTSESYEDAEFFHQGFGWAWFYISFHGGLFRFTPELHSLFGVTWCQFIGPDNVWPYAYEAFPANNPDKITWWTTPYKDLAWQKYQVSALVPIYDGPNREEFVGIIGVDVFMDSTEQIINTRKPTPNSHMMLVNREGFIIQPLRVFC